MPAITHRSTATPVLATRFLSHGTLECRDLAASRRFYEEVLGLEVVQQAPIALFVRLGGRHCIAVVETQKSADAEMPLMNHNGVDVGSDEEVDEAYRKLRAVEGTYGIRKMTKPTRQHGHYSFYLQDLDGNWWEVSHLPEGGYDFRFSDRTWDLTGRTDLDADQVRGVFQRTAAAPTAPPTDPAGD